MKTPLKFISIIVTAGLLLVLIAWLAGAFSEKIPPAKLQVETTQFDGQQYVITSVVEETMETATGTISARDETTVSSRILAGIQNILVRAGDAVEQGDVLVELDARDLNSRVEQASQSVLAARALLDDAGLEFDRVKNLYAQKVVARAEYDRSEATLRSRQAEFQRSQRQQEEAKTALSFTTINSPIKGKVIERYAEPGDTASPGKPLIKIYNPSLLRLDAQVRESLAAGINIGDSLNVYIDALDKQLPVVVDEIVPSADPGSRSITVKALLPAQATLYPGMFGRLLIPTGNVERIYVPTSALSRMGQLEFVRVLKAGTPSRRYIRTGASNRQDQLQVFSGLQVGEVIIIPLN